MKIIDNEDIEIVKKIEEALKKNNGYCPCCVEKTPETKCMCKDFREKIADKYWEGYCHCRRFKKVL